MEKLETRYLDCNCNSYLSKFFNHSRVGQVSKEILVSQEKLAMLDLKDHLEKLVILDLM